MSDIESTGELTDLLFASVIKDFKESYGYESDMDEILDERFSKALADIYGTVSLDSEERNLQIFISPGGDCSGSDIYAYINIDTLIIDEAKEDEEYRDKIADKLESLAKEIRSVSYREML